MMLKSNEVSKCFISRVMKKGKVFKQHTENKVFMGKLALYKDEIQILQNRLDEVAAKNNQTECVKNIEHFQNQLIIQKKC